MRRREGSADNKGQISVEGTFVTLAWIRGLAGDEDICNVWFHKKLSQ